MKVLKHHVIAPAWVAALIVFVRGGSPLASGGSAVPESAQAKPSAQRPSASPTARSQPPDQSDEDDEAALRTMLARRSLQENCLICHSEDMIAGQRLTPVQWKAEIDKMVNWGAPLPKEAQAPLIEYLARHYSDRSAPPVPTRAALEDVDSLEVPVSDQEPVPAGGDLAHGAQLYAANCATCHGPTALGGELGPSLVGKAILDHLREYNQIVRQGLRRMPGFPAVLKPKDQADILAWLRSRTYPE